MPSVVNILNLVLGAILLVAGRRLFWLLVAGIGFALGVMLAARWFNGNQVTAILAGLVLGGIFALLAVFLQSVAIGIAGFVGGGYILLSLATLFGLDRGAIIPWVIFIVGGVLGAMLVAFLFNWAIITISSLAGASMVVTSFGMTAATAGLVYLVLVIAGVLIQGATLRREERRSER